ncbi:MAG: hypothetical protein ABIS17_12020 [Casimicrobiaceae bacterium]
MSRDQGLRAAPHASRRLNWGRFLWLARPTPRAACDPGQADAGDLPVGAAALPAGESYEVRVLRSAISGFTIRASGGNAPGSSDERLRLGIVRQRVGIAWQVSF